MAWLKEHIGTITYPGDRATAFATVMRKLERLQIPIDEKNEHDGTISARCLSRPLDLFLWRYWSDKLLFHLTEDAERRTNIRVDAIPNLFRIGVRKHEHEIKLPVLLAELGKIE